MSPRAAPARWTAQHSSRVEMSSPSAQLVVVVVPRAGDEAVALPLRLSEITGRSRTQLAIELQRGEVELLRSDDRGEVSRMVEQLAAVGLLAVVREVQSSEGSTATPVAGEGWGRVLGAFDAKVAVAPPRAMERPTAGRTGGTESWQPAGQVPLRLGDLEADGSEHQEASVDGRGRWAQPSRSASPREVERDLMDEASGLVLSAAVRSPRGLKKASTRSKLPSARVVVVLLTMLIAAGLGLAIYQRMHRALGSGVVSATGVAPAISPPEPALGPAASSAPLQTVEKVRLLVDRAREACRSAAFERCREIADQALDLDETNRVAQALHIKAVTAISARTGQPPQNPTSPAGSP